MPTVVRGPVAVRGLPALRPSGLCLLGEALAGGLRARRGLRTPSRSPGRTHSEPDESSSTVPALMLMAMGMTPFSCSWRLCRGGGRGGGPPRLPSLAEEPRDEAVPCSRGSRRRLLFSLMVGRHFFLRMPEGQEGGCHEEPGVRARGCPGEPHRAQGKAWGARLPAHLCEAGQKGLGAGPGSPPTAGRLRSPEDAPRSPRCPRSPLLRSRSLARGPCRAPRPRLAEGGRR